MELQQFQWFKNVAINIKLPYKKVKRDFKRIIPLTFLKIGGENYLMRRNPDFERIFKQFKREVEREGIIKELKKKEFYEKPSQIRRKRKARKERRAPVR